MKDHRIIEIRVSVSVFWTVFSATAFIALGLASIAGALK